VPPEELEKPDLSPLSQSAEYLRGWEKLVIDRRCLAGGGHSVCLAPLKAVDEDPDEAGALHDIHFTNPGAGSAKSSQVTTLHSHRAPQT
jgi:hypothetical protein